MCFRSPHLCLNRVAAFIAMLGVLLFSSAAAAYCGKECRQARDFCSKWEKDHPGKQCGRVRGAICTGKNWKKIKQVNTYWSACELVGGGGDYNKALARCEEYEENWGGDCQVHSPACKAGWVRLGKYGSFRACRKRSASGSVRYDLYKAFMRRWEGKASISIPRHLHPFIKKQYGFDPASVRWGKVGDQPHSTCITDCDKIYCDSQQFIDLIRDGYNWNDFGNLAFHEMQHVAQCRAEGGRKAYAKLWFKNLRKGLGIGIKNFGLLSKKRRREMVRKVHDDMPMEKAANVKGDAVLAAYVEGWWHKRALCRVFAPDKKTIVRATTDSHPRFDCDPEYDQEVFKRLVRDAKKKVAENDLGIGRYHIAIGRPDQNDGAWIGTYEIKFEALDASAGISVSGETCPKPAKIVMLAATDGPRKLRVRRKLDGNWSRWKRIKAKKVPTGYLASYEEKPKDYLSPGKHQVDFQIGGYDKTVSATVEVKCPPFRIISADLKFDKGEGYLCPRKVTTTETYIANGPGQFRKRHEREGGAPGEWSVAKAERQGNQYVYSSVNTQTVEDVKQRRRVVAAPRRGKRWKAESGWTYFTVECLKIKSASIEYLGPKEGTCKFKTDARLRIEANLPVPVPYRLDCTEGQSLTGKIDLSKDNTPPFSRTDRVQLEVKKSGKQVCALKADEGKGLRTLTFQGTDLTCHDVLDAAVYIDGPKTGRCPMQLPVRVRVNARNRHAVPFNLKCTTGDNWNGVMNVSKTGPNTYIGILKKEITVKKSGKVACVLRSTLTGASKIVALRGKDFRCMARVAPARPNVSTPPKGPATSGKRLVCDKGTARGPRCICPRGWTRKRLAPRHFVCQKPERSVLRCAGGKVSGKRCVCPKGARMRRIGPNAFRCSCPKGTKLLHSVCAKPAL